MATRLKTVQFAFPTLASITNNTQTNLTQITVYLPENSKSFKSVIAKISCDDIITATGGTITTKTFDLRLGAAAYTSIANSGTLTNSGENYSLFWVADYTSHFTTNWSGTSMTCDFRAQINQSTGTTLGMVNLSVTLEITYEYDDTTTTHIKTVLIPLNAPTGALTTGATTYDTIPILDSYLPEASKTFRNIFVVVQGNEHRGSAATTDHTITLAVGTATVTTGNYEGSLASDRFFRYVWNVTSAYPSTAATQTFQASATVARVNHFQAWLAVTYEFNSSTTTSAMNSVVLPISVSNPMGGTTSTEYVRANTNFYIAEPGTITTNRAAFYVFYDHNAAIISPNMRIGTGSFVAYTDVANALCGNDAAMVRNDSAFTLARGVNNLNFDVYRATSTGQTLGWSLSGFYILNYTSSSIASTGIGSHNQSIFWGISGGMGTAIAAPFRTSAAVAITIPETSFFINNFGVEYLFVNHAAVASGSVQLERLTAEGGTAWEQIMQITTASNPEIGARYFYSNRLNGIIDRYGGDVRTIQDTTLPRIDIETSRSWRTSDYLTLLFTNLSGIFTYHAITYTVSGTITGSSGGTVNLDLVSDNGEVLLSTSRVGNGSYSFTWYDNTAPVYVTAYESSTRKGMSTSQVAGNTFDIELGGTTYYSYV